MRTLVLTTLFDSLVVDELRERGAVVALLVIDEATSFALDDLDEALDEDPPTSLASASKTWLNEAREVGAHIEPFLEKSGGPAEWDHIPDHFDQVIVAANRILPIDLIPCRGSLLGTWCTIAHVVPDITGESFPTLLESLEVRELPLLRLAHACTYYPGKTSLHEMDVVSATLRINNKIAMEHHFFPSREIAKSLFGRSDLDILHFECHGTQTSLQIDNPRGMPCDVRDLQSVDGPSIYLFLGCEVGADLDGVAPSFVRGGAKASLGSYCRFLSGGGSGEVKTSTFYDRLYQGLLSGMTLGESVRDGRRAAAPDRVYYCSWLLFGSPNIRFSVREFGR